MLESGKLLLNTGLSVFGANNFDNMWSMHATWGRLLKIGETLFLKVSKTACYCNCFKSSLLHPGTEPIIMENMTSYIFMASITGTIRTLIKDIYS